MLVLEEVQPKDEISRQLINMDHRDLKTFSPQEDVC